MGLVYDRANKNVYEELEYKQGLLNFLYNNVFGRVILKIIVSPIFSKIVGKYYDTHLSAKKIESFIKENNIDMTLFEGKDYQSFNEFFTRIKKNVNFDAENKVFCAPADSKMLVYKITDDLKIKVKNSVYSLNELIGSNEDILGDFKNGNCIIFRLAVNDYHRYHFIDDGQYIKSYYIKGKLHTVRSISENYRVYAENCREVNIIETSNFGNIIQIEVGAVLVGKIINNDVKKFKRGQEKGYFEYGGSTIVMLTKSNVKIDDDILENSDKNIETVIKVGNRIGEVC